MSDNMEASIPMHYRDSGHMGDLGTKGAESQIVELCPPSTALWCGAQATWFVCELRPSMLRLGLVLTASLRRSPIDGAPLPEQRSGRGR